MTNDDFPIYKTHRMLSDEIAKELHLNKHKVFRTLGRILSNRYGIPAFVRNRKPLYIPHYGTFEVDISGRELNILIEAKKLLKKLGKNNNTKGRKCLQGFPIEPAYELWKKKYANGQRMKKKREILSNKK